MVIVATTLAERYRRKAQKLRALAETMAGEDGRATVLRVAEGYDEMARRAELRAEANLQEDSSDDADGK